MQELLTRAGLIHPCCYYSISGQKLYLYYKNSAGSCSLKKACKIKSGSGVPNKTKVATISKAKIQKSAEIKMRGF